MRNETKILGIILLSTLLLLGGGVFLLSKNSAPQETGAQYQIDYSRGEKIGSDSAKVRLVEFSDLQCPACRAAEPAIKNVLSSNKEDVQFIYRHFPLVQHQYARAAANAVEAAGEQGKFWELHDKIFETQSEWTNLSSATDFFVNLAKELGLNENKIREAIEKNTYQNKIQEDISEGNKLGVNSTPTFYLNGRKLSLQNFDDLKKEVDKTIKN